MKQTLLNLCALLCLLFVGIGNAWGDEVTFSYSDYKGNGTASTGSSYTMTSDYASIGDSKFYCGSSATYAQLYASGTTTITPLKGATITSVVLTATATNFNGYQSSGTITASTGTVTGSTSSTTVSWTGSATTAFTISHNKQIRWTTIVVTYTVPATQTATAPTLPASTAFASSADIEITNNESGATVYYTTDGNDPTTSSSSFTGDSKTITIDATTTIKAMAVISGKDNSSIVSATYTYEKSIANTSETAYTTDEAIALVDAGSFQLAATEVYVKGTISKVDSYNSTYGSITYWLDSDAFEIYSGLSFEGAKFTASTDLQVGDEVVVKGLITKFSSTYEMNKNNVLISRKTAATQETPTLTLGTYKTVMTAGDADDEYTVTTSSDGEVSISSSDENIAEAIIVDGTVIVSAKAAGTTTITVTTAETTKYYATSKSYTLTIIEAASLPFSFDGGVADIATTQGMSQTGITKEYSSSPKLNFNDTSDELIIHYNAEAEILTYTIKGNSFSGGTFDVLESVDGIEYTGVKSYTELPSTAATETYDLNAASRYVKFVYTTKSSGNVALGAISITPAGVKKDPEFAFEKTAYTFTTDASDMAVKATSAAGSTGTITYALTEGDADKFLIDENTGDIVCETEGTYTVTATIAGDDNYETATATATVTIESAKETTPVALVAEYDNKYYAMDHSFGAVEVIIKDNKAYVASSDLKDAITWNMSTTGTETTFQSTDDTYLAPKSSTTLQLQDASYAWTFDSETNTWSAKVGNSTRSFFYGSYANAFKDYAVSNAGATGYSDMAQAYEIDVIDNSSSYVRENLTVGGYGTICLPYAVAEGEHSGATYYSITNVATDGTLALTEQTSLEAGMPYVFQATATTLVCMYSGSKATQPVRNTYLTGCFVDTNISSGYVLQYQDTDNDGEKDTYGFYKVDGTKTVPANRAYFSASVSGIKAFTFGDNTDAISSIETGNSHNDVIYNLAGQRVSKAQKGIYIINGKKILK